MKLNIIEELKWRGLIYHIVPGIENQLNKENTTIYVGFDPTADSLHIGNLLLIIISIHMYNFGHRPIILIGGATGMIGDPSGKINKRISLDQKIVNVNIEKIKKIFSYFLDFNSRKINTPILLNNYSWMKNFSFISFLQHVGKQITINYMMSKNFVKKRIFEENSLGMSFSEFTYQLIQAYDFYYLYKKYDCRVQLGGSDQWGNIITGIELIEKNTLKKNQVFGMTCPLITNADGSKLGKSEKKNIWLNSKKTSIYLFYQFWVQTSDADAEKYIKMFTFLSKNKIENLLKKHYKEPSNFLLQKTLAKHLTIFVHGEEECKKVIYISNILFSKNVKERLCNIDDATFISFFKSGPIQNIIQKKKFYIPILEFVINYTSLFVNKSEARRSLLNENSLSINQMKISSDKIIIDSSYLIGGKYILVEKGKKNKFIVKINLIE